MPFGAIEPAGAASLAQISPQQVAITRKSTELITTVMVQIVGGRNNPNKGLPSVASISGVGSRIDYQA